MRELDGMRIMDRNDGEVRAGRRSSTLRELITAEETGGRWSLGEATAEPDEDVATHLRPGEPEVFVILEGNLELQPSSTPGSRGGAWPDPSSEASRAERPRTASRRPIELHLAGPASWLLQAFLLAPLVSKIGDRWPGLLRGGRPSRRRSSRP
jgi:hypothetical protein